MAKEALRSWAETVVRRKVLAFAFCLDSIGVVDIGYRAAEARPERVEQMQGALGILADNLWLRVLLGAIAIGAAIRFSWKPGRVGMALLALVATGINYTFCAEFTGSVPNVLVCTGIALFAWLMTFVLARILWPTDARGPDFIKKVERLAGLAALAGFGIYFCKAGLSKYLNSGWDWTDGSKIRALMLMYAYPPDSLIGSVQEVIINSASLSRFLATLTLLAQIGALIFPFTRRGRMFIGTLLLGFELSVYFLAGIFAPGNIALIAGFSYPWHRLGKGKRAGDEDGRDLGLPPTQPGRARGVLLAVALITGLFWLIPPVEMGTPVTYHSRDMRGQGPASSSQTAPINAAPVAEQSPPAPPRVVAKKEYVLRPGQEERFKALLSEVGFGTPLEGGYRFLEIKLEPHKAQIHLFKDTLAGARERVGILELVHISLVRPSESASESFAIRPLEPTKDSLAKEHLEAAIRSVVAQDHGGYFMQVEKAPE